MDTNESRDNVPYIAYESMMAREERHVRRLILALVVTILLLFASNLTWLYFINQFEYSAEETVTVDGKSGVANYIGNDGTINNGEDSREKGPENDEEK
jgi:hypothetical protein